MGGQVEWPWTSTSRLVAGWLQSRDRHVIFREEEEAGDQGLTKVYGPNFGALINFMLHWNLNGGC